MSSTIGGPLKATEETLFAARYGESTERTASTWAGWSYYAHVKPKTDLLPLKMDNYRSWTIALVIWGTAFASIVMMYSVPVGAPGFANRQLGVSVAAWADVLVANNIVYASFNVWAVGYCRVLYLRTVRYGPIRSVL